MFYNLCAVGAFLTFASLVSAVSPAPEAPRSAEAVELVGTWRYSNDQQLTTYSFERNGTFTAALKTETGTRTFSGLWELKDGSINYTFTSDSADRQLEGKQDADRLERIDQSSFVIIAGDGTRRTYWRVK